MKANIMIVDEDRENCNKIEQLLTSMNHNVVAVSQSSESIVSQAIRIKPDLVLYDESLEISTGSSRIYDQIKQSLMIPVIYMQHHTSKRKHTDDSFFKPTMFLTKPIRKSELKLAVDFTLYTASLNSDLKQSEKTLKEYLELNRITLENISDPVFITNDDGEFTFVCPNVKHVLGFKVGEILKIGNIKNLVKHPQLKLDDFAPANPIENLETIILDNNQIARTFLCNIKRVDIKTGTTLFTFHDITGQKQAEEKLTAHEIYFKQVFEQAPIGIAVVDSNTGFYKRINRKFASLLGYSTEELLNQTYLDVTFHEDLEISKKNLDRLINEETEHFQLQKRYVSKDSKIKWVNLVVVPLWTKKPINPLHLVIAEDITKDRQLKDQSVGKDSDFTPIKKAKEDITKSEAGIAQNLRDAILPVLELLKDKTNPVAQNQAIEELSSNLKQTFETYQSSSTEELLKLTPVETEIAQKIKEGFKTSLIADQLNVSPQTIETHRKNIRKKLGLTQKKQNLKTYLSKMMS